MLPMCGRLGTYSKDFMITVKTLTLTRNYCAGVLPNLRCYASTNQFVKRLYCQTLVFSHISPPFCRIKHPLRQTPASLNICQSSSKSALTTICNFIVQHQHCQTSALPNISIVKHQNSLNTETVAFTPGSMPQVALNSKVFMCLQPLGESCTLFHSLSSIICLISGTK